MKNNFEKFSSIKSLAIFLGFMILLLVCISSANAVVNATSNDNRQQIINEQLDSSGSNTLNLAADDYQGEFTGYKIVANRNIHLLEQEIVLDLLETI
ncbi:hypothetical protein ALNOE001_08220 [Candidatus Methanobinarius endosymbioticus]|uniref:Uncharacterized protein n=1 Tax=Candidatus Methanobinarius endosymbioticus TaxID=2006182 RepID=A0A366MBH8_9EURY|nr:hypothetical protein ALNOE001_08220 [Candidatus Methanobinarius endosymbioticus]